MIDGTLFRPCGVRVQCMNRATAFRLLAIQVQNLCTHKIVDYCVSKRAVMTHWAAIAKQ